MYLPSLSHFRKTSLIKMRQLTNLSSGATALTGALSLQTNPAVTNSEEVETKVRPFHEIPGPPGLPFFGTVLEYMTGWSGLSFDKMFEAYRQRYEKYGPLYREIYGPTSIVVITDYSEYKKVIRADGRYPKRIPLEPLLTYRTRHGLDNGLVNGNGEIWYKYRSAINKKMLRPKDVSDFLEQMDDVTLDMMSALNEKMDENHVVDDLNSILFRWSMESVNTFLLDARLGTLDPQQSEKAEVVVDNIVGVFRCMQKLMFDIPFYKYVRTPMWKQFELHCDRAISTGLEIVNQRMEDLNNQSFEIDSEVKQSLVSYLLMTKGLSNVEISMMLVELMVGSVETTSNSLMWCLYLLAKSPHCQQRLYEEVSQVLHQGSNVTTQQMSQLKYTKACIREAMRLYPATFATSRVLNEDVQILGYNVPAGSHVQANTCTLCRDPKVFPDPSSFNPERWMSRDENSEAMAVTNLVWGHGARMCIGRRVAEQEMYLGLSRIIQKYHVWYPEMVEPDPVLHTVMTTRTPMKMKFSDRAML